MAGLLPVWFPWLLRPLAAAAGVRYDRYERVGMSRFALVNATWASGDFTVRAQRIEAFLPHVWVWRARWGGGTRPGTEPFAAVRNWQARRVPRAKPPPGDLPSAVDGFDRLRRIAVTAQRWLPTVHLDAGELILESGRIRFPSIDWRETRLEVAAEPERLDRRLSLSLDLPSQEGWELIVRDAATDLVWSNRLARTASGLRVDGRAWLGGRRAELEAEFDATGWWPRNVQIATTAFPLFHRYFGWPDDGGLDGSFTASWDGERFSVRAFGKERASGDPDAASWQRPLDLDLLLEGDRSTIALRRLNVRTPAFSAELAEPKVLRRGGVVEEGDARLRLAVDLGQLPGAEVRGRIAGSLRASTRFEKTPRVQFDVAGDGLEWRGVSLPGVAADGWLDWPRLQLTQLRADLGEGSKLEVRGELDLAKTEVLDGAWHLEGAPPLLPTNVFCQSLSTTGSVRGPLRQPQHAGRAEVRGFQWKHFPAADLEVEWEAVATNFHQVSLSARRGNLTAAATGSFRFPATDGAVLDAEIRTLQLERAGTAAWNLTDPSRIRFEGPALGRVTVERLRLAGPGRELAFEAAVEGGRRGRVNLHGTSLSASDFADWLPGWIHPLRVGRVDIDATWEDGPVHLRGDLSAEWSASNTPPASIAAKLVLARGLRVDALQIDSGGVRGLSAQGDIPLALEWLDGRLGWRWRGDAPLRVEAEAELPAAWCDWLAAQYLVHVRHPRLRLTAGGTSSNPEGRIELAADRGALSATNGPGLLAAVDNVRLAADFREQALRITEGRCLWSGQALAIGGVIPFVQREGKWQPVRSQARISVDAQWELARIAEHLPGPLQPSGTLEARVTWLGDRQWDGYAEVRRGSVRVLESLPAVRDLECRIELDNGTARINRFSGRMGGVPVSLSGEGDWVPGTQPRFALELRGTNVPLARQTGLTVRGDVQLRLAQTNDSPALLAGRIDLRDSLLVSDLFTLVEPKPRTPRAGSLDLGVQNALLSRWKLEVAVQGDRALRVRTPVLQGEASANLHVRGTLGTPTVVGEIRMDQGTVLFPFGRLVIQQAAASFETDAPLEPRLFVLAGSRVYGYQLTLEITGTLGQPNMVFGSSPPLGAQEILLLLTTGQLPRDEARFSTGDKVGRLGLFLGRDLLDRLGGSSGAAPRLEVRSGQDLSVEGRSTYEIEYRLTDRWSAYGELDRFGAVNGGLKWRLYSR